VGLSSFSITARIAFISRGRALRINELVCWSTKTEPMALLVLSAVRKDCMFFCSWSAAANLTGTIR